MKKKLIGGIAAAALLFTGLGFVAPADADAFYFRNGCNIPWLCWRG